jgi:hypothetical protein
VNLAVEVTTNHPWADGLRVIALVLGGMNIAVVGYVLVIYTRVYLLDRRIARVMGKSNWHGLLPRHVVLVAVSHVILTLFAMRVGFGRLHEPLSWRAPLITFAFICTLWSLWDVLGHEKAKMVHPPSDHAPPLPPDVRP